MPLIPPNGLIAQAFGGVSPGQALDVGAIKELSTKVNLYRTYLRAAGLMA